MALFARGYLVCAAQWTMRLDRSLKLRCSDYFGVQNRECGRDGGGLQLRVRQMDRALVVSVGVEDDLLAQYIHGIDGENPTSAAIASTASIPSFSRTSPNNKKLTVASMRTTTLTAA